MYGRFLLEAATVNGCDGLAGIGDEFVTIGDRWTDLSFLFKDLSSDGGRAVQLAHPIALEIYERERSAFERLEAESKGWSPG
jgi:hypothetical protein